MSVRTISATPAARQRAAFTESADLTLLAGYTPAQIDAWVDANVTTIAGARRVLKVLLLAAAIQFRDMKGSE